MAKSHLSVLIV